MDAMRDNPVDELMSRLNYHLQKRALAQVSVYRNPTRANIEEALGKVDIQEKAVIKIIRQWVVDNPEEPSEG